MSEESSGQQNDALRAMLELDHPRKIAVAEWATQSLPLSQDVDPNWVVSRDVWRRAAAFGIQGQMAPVAAGGSASSAVDTILTFEGLGLGGTDGGLVFALAAQTVTVQQALIQSGTDEQVRRWLDPLVAGDHFGSFAVSEPNAGSDPWLMTTTADLQTDGSYVLNGTKSWVTLGPICDTAIVFAATDSAKGRWGITAFVIDADTPGFQRGPAREKMGLTACPFGDLILTDCQVSPGNVLGRVGSGAAIFGRIVEAERAFLYAGQLGAIEHIVDRTVERARTREQSGRHIGSFQAVSHRIVEMKLRHEAARLLLYKAAALADRNEPIALASALAKLQTADSCADSMLDAMRVFGAYGYTNDAGLAKELADVLGGFSYSGTQDIARNVVTSLLRVDRPQRTTNEPTNTDVAAYD